MIWGAHCLKTWSSTQTTIALSSAEAELYALTKGAAQGLGMMALLSDFGIAVNVIVHTDASAAIGIVRRAGLGKLRHLNVRYLWVQDQVKRELLGLEKVAGAENPADIATKHFNAEVMKRHLDRMGIRTSGGRARSAPVLGSLGRALTRRGRRGGARSRDKDGEVASSCVGVAARCELSSLLRQLRAQPCAQRRTNPVNAGKYLDRAR